MDEDRKGYIDAIVSASNGVYRTAELEGMSESDLKTLWKKYDVDFGPDGTCEPVNDSDPDFITP